MHRRVRCESVPEISQNPHSGTDSRRIGNTDTIASAYQSVAEAMNEALAAANRILLNRGG